MSSWLYLCILLFSTSCFSIQEVSNQPYHLRQVYYNESENICGINEFIGVIFSFVGQKTLTQSVSTQAYCMNSFESAFWRITSQKAFETQIEDQWISFKTQIIRINPYGVQRAILMNSTLETTKIEYEKINYDCIIKGNGGIEHFNRADEPQQTFIKVECNRNEEIKTF